MFVIQFQRSSLQLVILLFKLEYYANTDQVETIMHCVNFHRVGDDGTPTQYQ